MKNFLTKMLWGFTMLVTLTCTLAVGLMITNKKAAPTTQVATVQTEKAAPSSAQNGKIYAERTTHVYIYYYRKHNGWIQRRLWDRTLGRWADPYWKNVQKY